MSHKADGDPRDPLSLTPAERAEEARLEETREHEAKLRYRRELGLDPAPLACREHGNDPALCPLCRDWTAVRHLGVNPHAVAV